MVFVWGKDWGKVDNRKLTNLEQPQLAIEPVIEIHLNNVYT